MKKKILIIEDNITLQKSLKSFLEQEFHISQLFEGSSVLEFIEEEKPDLIILDLMLPVKDGFHVLREIKDSDKFSSIPVMILTVIDTDSSIEECRSIGADDYLTKSDFSLDEVMKRVKKLLN